MARQRINLQDQTKMDGIDTDLSVLADEFIEAQNDVIKSKSFLGEVEQRFIECMRDKSKNTITHEGRTFTVRKGHLVKEAIIVK